jgi:hypothetical protein
MLSATPKQHLSVANSDNFIKGPSAFSNRGTRADEEPLQPAMSRQEEAVDNVGEIFSRLLSRGVARAARELPRPTPWPIHKESSVKTISMPT